MPVISAQSGPEGRDHRQARRRLFPWAGHTRLTSLVTLAAAMVVAAVLPVTAGTSALAADGAAAATPSSTAWAHVAAGGSNTCGVSTNGTLWCWGFNSTTGADLPQQVTTPAATGWATVSAALNNICAIRTNRTLWCWSVGSVPTQVTTPSAGGWATVSAGDDHMCATRTDATLWCWGTNNLGQLGIGNTTSEALPQQVTTPAATGWATVTAGSLHTCATRSDTSLWCWGDNMFGELGIGSTAASEDTPQQVTTPAATGWASVAAGGAHTCATRSDTSLWCWGDGFVGELGIGSATNEDTPQQVTTPAATGWATVSPGENFTCGTRAGGTLWCWGFNGSGRLGIGSGPNKSVPQQVAKSATTPWATVSAGGDHACATRTNRTLWCWGNNAFGQLGLGNTTTETRPKQVTA
jgi:alpha-tubulin suppressor-like RCC1 family protein